jgi:hypothetical protein
MQRLAIRQSLVVGYQFDPVTYADIPVNYEDVPVSYEGIPVSYEDILVSYEVDRVESEYMGVRSGCMGASSGAPGVGPDSAGSAAGLEGVRPPRSCGDAQPRSPSMSSESRPSSFNWTRRISPGCGGPYPLFEM